MSGTRRIANLSLVALFALTLCACTDGSGSRSVEIRTAGSDSTPAMRGSPGVSCSFEVPRTPPALQEYLGLTEQAAFELAAQQGRIVRVVRADDRCFPHTSDLRPHRVNLTLVAHRVAAARLG